MSLTITPHLYHLNGKDFSNIPMERFGRICLPVSLTSFQSREGPRPGKMTYFKKDWVLICVWGVSYLVLPPFHFLIFFIIFCSIGVHVLFLLGIEAQSL